MSSKQWTRVDNVPVEPVWKSTTWPIAFSLSGVGTYCSRTGNPYLYCARGQSKTIFEYLVTTRTGEAAAERYEIIYVLGIGK